MGAGNTSLQTSIPNQLQLGGGNCLTGEILPRHGATPVQQYYHERPCNTNHKLQAPTIPGGSYSIPPITLLMVWAAYRQRKLDWLALRVWMALWEIKCWYEARSEPDEAPHYDTSQITSAIKSPNLTTKRLDAALSVLQHLNLVNFTSTTIWIAISLDDLRDPELRQLAEHMISHIGHANLDRGLRMPRRMLVFLMTSQRPKPVYAGVMFALLIRTMLTKRYETYKGCCTASWIALVFGGDPSSIKSARTQLIADGWFARLETPQRVRQRYGEWVVLVIEQPVENHDETEPLTPRKSDETEPPIQNQSLSDEIETNQSLHPGASQPKWENIQPLDLHTPKRREQLYHAAQAAGVIPSTEAHKHTFFAAIAHATRVATRNACGLLRRVVETTSYHRFISQTDEDQASLWLQALQPQFHLDSQSPAEPTGDLYDQQIVSCLRHRLQQTDFPTDNCFALIMTTHEGKTNLAGWTKERWDRAVTAYQEQGTLTLWAISRNSPPFDAAIDDMVNTQPLNRVRLPGWRRPPQWQPLESQ